MEIGWIVSIVLAVMLFCALLAYGVRVNKYFALEEEYNRLLKVTHGLEEIGHQPESMWPPSKEWGEWVMAAMVRTGYLK